MMACIPGIRSVSGAVLAAAELLEIAGQDAKAITETRDAEEREQALRSLGVEPGGTVPPALRAQLKALEEDQKRRATRSLRDGIDRILVDLLSLYRDILLLQLDVELEPVNLAIYGELTTAATAVTATAGGQSEPERRTAEHQYLEQLLDLHPHLRRRAGAAPLCSGDTTPGGPLREGAGPRFPPSAAVPVQ